MKERIKQLRKKLKLSQSAFGEMLGMSGPAISLIESGKNTASESTIRLICKTFNVRYKWLTEGVEPMYEESLDNMIDRMFDTDFERSVLKAFLKLPDADIKMKQVIEMMDKLKNGEPPVP